MSSSGQYRIASELQPSHQSDVKAVLAVGDKHLVSASRDKTVLLWTRLQEDANIVEGNTDDGTNALETASRPLFEVKTAFGGHGEYVNSLAHVPGEGMGMLASGGNSTMILLHDLTTLDSEPVQCLIGHTGNVCALRYAPKLRKLLSSSWDLTARVWTESEGNWSSIVLEGHDAAVWDVLAFEEGVKAGCYLTGSADCTVRLWSSTGEALERFKGSPEPIRSLTLLYNPDEFASASNDGKLRVWDTAGSVLATLNVHTDYVYKIGWENDRLLSCGEDKTLRVSDKHGDLEATLLHPCQSVWGFTTFPDGLIVTAGSDGVIRAWEHDPKIEAPEPVSTKEPAVCLDGAQEKVSEPHRLVIDIDYADDKPPIPCVHEMNADPRETAATFVSTHGLAESYVDRIEEFIRMHLR